METTARGRQRVDAFQRGSKHQKVKRNVSPHIKRETTNWWGMAQENRNSTLAAAVVNAKSVFDVLTDSKKAKDIGADVLDIRLDHITDLKNENALSEILKGKILPVIISLR